METLYYFKNNSDHKVLNIRLYSFNDPLDNFYALSITNIFMLIPNHKYCFHFYNI